MKIVLIAIGSFLFNATLWGVESINDQIEAIKNAPPTERVELMNRLKIQIAAMNEEDRANALETLQQSRGGSGSKLQLRIHQGGSGEGSGSMQRLQLHKNSSTGQKQQGRP